MDTREPAGEDDALARWRDSAWRAAGHAYESAHGREIEDASRGMRWAISPRVALTAAGALALLGLGVWAWFSADLASDTGGDAPAWATATPAATMSAATMVAEDAHATRIVVHVSGAVVSPGLVDLETGERVADAIEKAGGARGDADVSALNLARVPHDGEQIDVPSEDDGKDDEGGGTGVPGSGGLVRLNLADAAELDTLPGVGPVTAQNIVADRDANGPFASLDDLQRVSGIGPALVARLDGLVTM